MTSICFFCLDCQSDTVVVSYFYLNDLVCYYFNTVEIEEGMLPKIS